MTGMYSDTLGKVFPGDFFFEAVRGRIPGYKYIHKFGFAEGVNTSKQTIWTGTNSPYLFPGSATNMAVTSTVSGDHGSRVRILGLNSAYNSIDETVTLIGNEVESTTNLFQRVHRVVVISASNGITNQGQIWVGNGIVTAQVPANKFAHIESSHAQTLQAIYTVPASHTLFITNMFFATTVAKTATFHVEVAPFGQPFQHRRHFDVFQTAFNRPYAIPLPIAEKSDIKVECEGAAAGTNATAEFDGIITNQVSILQIG